VPGGGEKRFFDTEAIKKSRSTEFSGMRGKERERLGIPAQEKEKKRTQ